MSVAHHHLADAQTQLGDLEGALESYRRSRALAVGLSEEFPDNQDYRGLAGTANFWIAGTLADLGRYAEALAIYREGLATDSVEVRADPKNAIATNGLAINLMRVADMQTRLGHLRQALSAYRQSLAIGVEVFQADSGNLYKRVQLMESQNKICGVLGVIAPNDAETECAKAARFMDATVLEPSNAGYRGYLAGQYSEMAHAYDSLVTRSSSSEARRRFLLAALDMYRRSSEIWTDLQNRRLVNPTDTARVSAAAAAVMRAEAKLDQFSPSE